MGATESVPLDEWRRAMDINLYGVLLRAARSFRISKKPGGVNHCSQRRRSNQSLPNISAYAASKAAVVRLMETLAAELKPFRVDVNAIAPARWPRGWWTRFWLPGRKKSARRFTRKTSNGKKKAPPRSNWGQISRSIFASAQSDGITGKLISAQWDPWEKLHEFKGDLDNDIYTLRRIVPKDRGKTWGISETTDEHG